jgi:hypothetical protein
LTKPLEEGFGRWDRRHSASKVIEQFFALPAITSGIPTIAVLRLGFPHLTEPTCLTTKLKSCSYCLRPTTRPFMNNQEPELNPKPDETDSAKTNESVQRERSELPAD